jgi:hypothetical protein
VCLRQLPAFARDLINHPSRPIVVDTICLRELLSRTGRKRFNLDISNGYRKDKICRGAILETRIPLSEEELQKKDMGHRTC